MKNLIFLVTSLLLFSNFTFAGCYVDANLKCEAIGTHWTGKGPIIRKLLLNSAEVQKNPRFCAMYAALIKTECQIPGSVQAVYTDRVSYLPMFVTAYEPTLPMVTDLPEVMKDYFAGLLQAPPLPIDTIRTDYLNSILPGLIQPTVLLTERINGTGNFPISSNPALAISVIAQNSGYRLQIKPVWGSSEFNSPLNPAPDVGTFLIDKSFSELPSLIDLTVSFTTSVSCQSKGEFKFKIDPRLFFTGTTNVAYWPRLNMTNCGNASSPSYNLGSGNYTYTMFHDKASDSGISLIHNKFIFKQAPLVTFPVTTSLSFDTIIGDFLEGELPLTVKHYYKKGLDAPVEILSKTFSKTSPEVTVTTFGYGVPPKYLVGFNFSYTPKITDRGDYLFYSIVTTAPGVQFTIRDKHLLKLISTQPLNGACSISNTPNYLNPAPCSAGNLISSTRSLSNWSYTCAGINGGTNANCTSPVPPAVQGICKTYSSSYLAHPALEFSTGCSSGEYEKVADTVGFFNWRCKGSFGGATGTCQAVNSLGPVAGKCKILTGRYTNQPANSTFSGCEAGTYADAPESNLAFWKWTCNPTNAGTVSETCYASTTTAVAGECKLPNNSTSTITAFQCKNKSECCVAGEYLDTADSSTNWNWSCTGYNGGASKTCTNKKAGLRPPPECRTFATPPVIKPGTESFEGSTSNPLLNGCNHGYFKQDIDTATHWKWKCNIEGYADLSCQTLKPTNLVNGICGSLNGKPSVLKDEIKQSTYYNKCNAGSIIDQDRLATTGGYKWQCAGLNGGTTANCGAPYNVTCGLGGYDVFDNELQETTNIRLVSTIPNTNDLCSLTSATKKILDANAYDGRFNWECSSSGGGVTYTKKCQAFKNDSAQIGVCGSAAGILSDRFPESNQCQVGEVISIARNDHLNNRFNTWNWVCSGVDGGPSRACSAPRTTNGICGSANGVNYLTFPQTNLCHKGLMNPLDTVAADGVFDWKCEGNLESPASPHPTNGLSVTCSTKPLPAGSCAAGLRKWSAQGTDCEGFIPASLNGTSALARQDINGFGSASFTCNNGTWSSTATNAKCFKIFSNSTYCPSSVKTWSQNGINCQFTLPLAYHDESILAKDRVQANTTTDGIGNAVFSCMNGNWESTPHGMSCANKKCIGGTFSRSWTVSGLQCAPDNSTFPTLNPGQSITITDNTAPTIGSATLTCTDGAFIVNTSTATCNSSTATPASPCLATTKSWTVGSSSCSANLAQANSGSSGTSTDSVTPVTGSATYSCNNGTWSTSPTSSTCVTATTASPCLATTKSWTVGSSSCSANLAQAISGASVTTTDSVTPTTGSATYKCSSGTWSSTPTNASCGTSTVPIN